jgi:hypothetical protein
MHITSRESLDAVMAPLTASFPQVTLEEMNRVPLLDRNDTKYVMDVADLPAIMKEAVSLYNVLEVKGNRNRKYETIYFDSEDNLLYRMHHNGKASRYKLRIRRYLDTGQTFYELKAKNPKSRTVKTRIKYDGPSVEGDQLLAPFSTFCSRELELLEHPKSTLTVHFDRMTLMHATEPERITIDTGLELYADNDQKAIMNLCIVEVKQPRDRNSPFAQIMHRNRIFPMRISKYCLGMILLHQDLKMNNFKPRMLRLQKILNKSNRDNLINII